VSWSGVRGCVSCSHSVSVARMIDPALPLKEFSLRNEPFEK
jgi:hypothetical protein